MHAPHKLMINMICVHYSRSSILLTSEGNLEQRFPITVNKIMKKGIYPTMSIIPEQYQDILQSTAVAYMATIGPKGEPQVSPVLFSWDGTYFLFSMNKVRQKHRNLVREPRIALAITDPTNPYRSLE